MLHWHNPSIAILPLISCRADMELQSPEYVKNWYKPMFSPAGGVLPKRKQFIHLTEYPLINAKRYCKSQFFYNKKYGFAFKKLERPDRMKK